MSATLCDIDKTHLLEQLNDLFEVEFTFLDTRSLAISIAALSHSQRLFYLDLAKRITSTQVPLAYEIITRAINHNPALTNEFIEKWALYTMDTYDCSGLQAAMALARQPHKYQEHYHIQTHGVTFTEIENVLGHFVQGLSGRPLKLQATNSTTPYTDSETIYLPRQLATQSDKKTNFELYKAIVVYLWSQTRFGSFREPLEPLVEQLNSSTQLKKLFSLIESIRLEKLILAQLPGMQRIFHQFKPEISSNQIYHALSQKLHIKSSRDDCLHLTCEYPDKIEQIPEIIYTGAFNFDAVINIQHQRIIQEKAFFKVKLEQQLKEMNQSHHQLSIQKNDKADEPNTQNTELTLDGIALKLPQTLNKLRQSIMLDFGHLPPDYLTPAGSGDYEIARKNEAEQEEGSVWHGTYHENNASLYDEWDHLRKDYRKSWCAVREIDIETVNSEFIQNTYTTYKLYIHRTQRIFEALRDDERRLKKQSSGDDIDLDAFVDSFADQLQGHEISEQLFTRLQRHDRNIAVMFMVDMSGSTKGWINDAEREALIILSNAISRLGDRFAIYGFSGISRKRCEIFKVKSFEEVYNHNIDERISGIEAKDYTRMGPAIRHLSDKLNQTGAKTRILITLSDGKPDDYNDYHGEYGIEDTRRALIEAKRNGIHPYCITIDHEARDYLSRMYGPAAFTVINNVRQLPLKVSDIYRKLAL